jgi:hypothetical protein
MRDFNEIKAEILRRSDDRIKEKKRKRKIYTAYGLSLCLCITVSALLLPKLVTRDFAEGDNAPYDVTDGYFTDTAPTLRPEMSKDVAYETDGVYILSAELSNGENTLTLSDKKYLSELMTLFDKKEGAENSDQIFDVEEEVSEEESYVWEGNLPDDYSVPEDAVVDESCAFDESINFSTSAGYQITLRFSDGSVEKYMLIGNLLKNEYSDETIILSESKRDLLFRLFDK